MRRPDPYETRARELAVAAGLNPDDRIGEGRGMPLWCRFRDAARQEQAVDPIADTQAVFLGVEVDVSRARLDRLVQDLCD